MRLWQETGYRRVKGQTSESQILWYSWYENSISTVGRNQRLIQKNYRILCTVCREMFMNRGTKTPSAIHKLVFPPLQVTRQVQPRQSAIGHKIRSHIVTYITRTIRGGRVAARFQLYWKLYIAIPQKE